MLNTFNDLNKMIRLSQGPLRKSGLSLTWESDQFLKNVGSLSAFDFMHKMHNFEHID